MIDAPAARAAMLATRRVLLIEDNPDLAFGLRNNLEIEGYEVEVVGDGTLGLERARAEPAPDLVILDLMLPGLDGYRLLSALRDAGAATPVLILTARGEEADKVRGFRLGADDYVTKPFGVLELMARVEAILRRATTRVLADMEATARFGDVEIDPSARLVRRDGRMVDLSPKEFDLLLVLARRQNQVLSRAELLKLVWGYDTSVVSRTVDTHIAELRRKLEASPSSPRHIATVWKLGYRLVP